MMFQTWELEVDPARQKRLGVAVAGALAVLVALFALAMLLPGSAVERSVEPAVVVAFRPAPPPVVKKVDVPVTAPPKVARPKPPPVAVVAPVVEAPPAPAAAPMVAPKVRPTERPPETTADKAVEASTVAVGGTGDGRGAAVGTDEKESAAPVVATAGHTGPINLPEDAEPAEPDESNVMPEYPESARTTGQEAVVILKIVILSDGRVGKVQVLKGEDPFLAAALKAVRSWTYAPARLDGQAISIFKIIKLPFRLRND